MPQTPARMDPEKVKLIRYQLMMLLHSRKCKREDGGAHHKCRLQHCDIFKQVHKHMASCMEESSCNFLHCMSSKRILSHWINCPLVTCSVCLPLGFYKKDLLENQIRVEDNLPQLLDELATNHPESPIANLSSFEKVKKIQHRFVYLIHAHNCQLRENGTNGEAYQKCTLPHCGILKVVFKHMEICGTGKTCLFPHCAASRQILIHWKNCQVVTCPVCSPFKYLKQMIQDRKSFMTFPEPQTPLPEIQEPYSDFKKLTFTEKQKLVQDQLLVLLHAQECLVKENGSDGEYAQVCTVTQCRIFKKLVIHVKTCQNAKCCSFPYCSSSRQIMVHWETCTFECCLVCGPFRIQECVVS